MLPPHGDWVTEAIPGRVEGLKSAATSRSLGNRGYVAISATHANRMMTVTRIVPTANVKSKVRIQVFDVQVYYTQSCKTMLLPECDVTDSCCCRMKREEAAGLLT